MTLRVLQRIATTLALVVAVGGCSTVGDYYDRWFGSGPKAKPAELVAFKPTAAAKILWQGNTGTADKYVFTPVADASAVYAAGASGQITRFDARSGKTLARFDAKSQLSGGVGSDGRMVFAGTTKGEVLAFDTSGKPVWKAQLNSEVLSAPQVEQGVVVVRSGDSRIFGLDLNDGARKWVYQRTLPALTVRSYVGIAIHRAGGVVFAGFPGGRLVALAFGNGNLVWDVAVALPKGATELERVTDISGLPVFDNRQVCAVAFQGRVACYDLLKGAPMWGRDISSASGMGMDTRNVYVSDDKGAVVAFDKLTGASLWKQDKLFGRNISGPIPVSRYVAVGDFQGYVHFLSNDDGSFAARVATDGSAIIAPPIAINDGILVQTRNGGVFAISVQ